MVPSHDNPTPNNRCAALLLFNEALPLLKKQAPTSFVDGGDIERYFALQWDTTVGGCYAMVVPSTDHHDSASRLLGRPVSSWPEEMTAEMHKEVCQTASDRAWRMLRAAPDEIASESMMRMKINDRVFNRMEPIGRVERLLENAIQEWGLSRIVTPWVADQYDTVERPGMIGLNSPGHRLVALLRRLRERYGIQVDSLWPDQIAAERRTLLLSRTAMASARGAKLVGRAIRDTIRPRPAGATKLRADLPALGFIVGGAAPWYHTKPLVDACEGRFQPVIIAHDIFRNPTSYQLLKKTGVPFVPIDSLLPLPSTLARLWRGVRRKRRLARQLKQWRRTAGDVVEEPVAELRADLESLPELQLYVDQIRAAIRKFRLTAIVSSNVLDSLLSAGGEACRAEGIPKVCIQNTTAAHIAHPLYADCDYYFAESQEMADFMRHSGAHGEVEVVGLPFYDELARHQELMSNAESEQVIRDAFPELRGKRIVSLIAAPKNYDYQPLVDPLVEMISRRDDCGLIIRLHPRSEPTQYEQLGRELQAKGLGGRMHHAPLAAFLADTDYMVAGPSSTTHSALVMGVRPFCWISDELKMYADETVQMHPEIRNRWTDPRRLVAALERALDDPRDDVEWKSTWERFVARYMTGTDGRACERIIHRLTRIAG